MKELGDIHCEVRKIVDLQIANWYCQNNLTDDDTSPVPGSPGSKGSTNFMGGFLDDANYAWLSCGPKLVVFNVKTGINISTWTFRERVSCLSPFPAQPGQIPLLLVGLDNGANKIKESCGMVCVFDSTMSQVLRAIRMPAGVEQLCIINGGTESEETNDQKVDDILEGNHGMACVALRNIDHYVVDLKRNSWENLMNIPLIDETNPAEIDIPDFKNTSTRYKSNKERHIVHNLMHERLERFIGFNRDDFESSILCQEKMTTSLICSRKIGCLISGCLGRIIIWENNGVVRWISSPIDNSMTVSHLALLEPTDDPRPFCYLWAAYQEEAPSNVQPILRMYAMLFERKYSDKGINFYSNLEGEPSLKFELEMEGKNHITSLCPIVREYNQEQTESGNKRGEDNLLLINVDGKTILFDLNQWYKEQMPRFIGESHNPDAILCSYESQSDLSQSDIIISCAYVPSTLKEFPCTTFNTPEELFYPNSLSLEWVELGINQLTFLMTRGIQTQLLREMVMAGPTIMIQPSEIFHRCLRTGLIQFNPETSINDSADSQRDSLLTLCLEQRWTVFLLKCAKKWADGSAAYLYPAFLRWGMQRASSIQLTAHQLCIPLFDQSGSSIGETEVKTLRFFSQQMECLCNVIENLPIETDDLDKQRRILRRISTYLQILLWFYDVGLLPETQEIDEESLPISFILKIPYPAEKLASIYKEKRKQYRQNDMKKDDNEFVMFIDELIMKECPAVKLQWEQESNEINYDGHYPPPSLQSLLRSCLIDCHQLNTNEMENKHQIIIYLLMDLVMLLQGSCPGVDQLIKYPSAFKLSPSLIKLTQALWLLDHEDYHGFLDIMTGQLVLESDIKEWHHKLVMRTLLRNNQNKLALIYIRVRKPPLSSIDDQGTVISLSVEHGLVQSAFHHRPPSHYSQLLTKFFRACKAYGKLNDILHLLLDNDEEEAFIQFLSEEKCEETRLIYYLQHSRYNEANNVLPIDANAASVKKGNKPASFSIFHAYNATLPNIIRRFSTNLNRRNTEIDTHSAFPRPMSHYKSRVGTRDIYDTAIRKAKETFVRNDKSQIPFISTPCSSLRTNFGKSESNCVLYVERVQQLGVKRTLQDVQDDDTESRKRQKINESNDRQNDVNTQMNMVFGTPLVKRKNQIINAPDTPLETPHSILKIRQMICDSVSPSSKVSSSEGDKMPEREKKPRQIRFSINQPQIDYKTNGKTSMGDDLIDDVITRLDTTESIKSSNITPSNHSDIDDDEYYSPNANVKSFNESTVLTDTSSYHSKSLSGPRPRPGLRRNIIDSPFDGLGKSLFRHSTMITDSSPNSAKTSADVSITSDIVSSTFMDPYTSRVSQNRLSLPSTSIYASTVLSSHSSMELSSFGIPRDNKDNVSRTLNSLTVNKVDLSVKHNSLLGDKSNQDSVSSDNLRTSITKSNAMDNNSEDDDDDSDEEVIKNTEEFTSNVQDQIKDGEDSMKMDDEIEETNFVILPKIPTDYEDTSNDKYDEDNQHESSPISQAVTNNFTESGSITDDDTANVNPMDDYDDELLTLKYNEEEDDNDEVFKSLSNSVDRDHCQLGNLSDKFTMQNNSPEKSAFKRFYDENNMTDDESSRSVDQIDTMDILNNQNMEINNTTSVFPVQDDVDITDDKSDVSFEPTKPTTDCDDDKNEHSEIMTINDTLLDKASSEPVLQDELEAVAESQTAETNNQMSLSLAKSFCEIIPEEEGQTSTPIRMTRSRRASSVVPIMQEPLLETPENQKIHRTRRANSLAKETHSTPKMPTCAELFGSDGSKDSQIVKRGRGRRSTSLMKEILASSVVVEPNLPGVVESPQGRRTRRATSIQRDVSITVTTPIKNSNISTDTCTIEENSMDEVEPVKKSTRGKSTTANRGIDIKTRKTRATSITEEIDNSALKKNTKLKRTRAASMSVEIDGQIEVENSVPVRKTRAISTSKESKDKSTTKATKITQTKVEKASNDIDDKISSEDIPLAGRTRAASVSKENTEEQALRRKRASSLTNDITVEVPGRRKRAASLSKDIENNSTLPKRQTRASSLIKEVGENCEIKNKRVTRRTKLISKDIISEPLRTGRGSIIQDIIPEEDADESIFTRKSLRSIPETVNDLSQNHSDTTRISAIPEEDENNEAVSSDISKKKEKKLVKNSTRSRRAASVDLPQIETKLRTRSLAKSIVNEDHNGTEESPEVDGKNKSTRKTTVRRKARAVSETKELKDLSIVERPKRGIKISQTNDETNDPKRRQLPEEIRSSRRTASDETKDFVFSSPETMLGTTSSKQPRRPIANFISPLTDEEKKLATNSSIDKSNNDKHTRRTQSLIGFRTKFIIRSQNNSK